MASIFGHALIAATLTKSAFSESNGKIFALATFCSIFPDADVVLFEFGIAYDHWLGHRGFFHSLLFCILFGWFLSCVFIISKDKKWKAGILFSMAGISHGILDAMTNGGRGVAFLSPLDTTRYFLPWRPIQVSPIGISSFFSDWGLRVLASEIVYIGLPCLVAWTTINILRRKC